MAEISGRSRGAVKLHNIGDNPMMLEVIEWLLIGCSVILETFDNNGGGRILVLISRCKETRQISGLGQEIFV